MDKVVIMNQSGNLSIYEKETGDLTFTHDLDDASKIIAIKNLAASLEIKGGKGYWVGQHGYHP